MSDVLKGYLKARTNQAGAFLTHFSESHYARWTGACLGQTFLWMRLNAANPGAAATDRLDALASFEGATHATIHQRAYADNRSEGYTVSRMFGIDSWSAKPGTHDAVYNRPMNELHRIGAHVHSHTGLTLEQLPQALRDVDGYATVELDLPRGERHAWGLHKTSEAEVTIFDSNYGEFRVPAGELPDFLRHINQQIGADLAGPVVRVCVRPCVVDARYEDTPAADLCGWLATSAPGSQQAPAVPEAVMDEAHPSDLDAAAPLLRRRPTAGSP
ncbi:YopT-type cysteine protease domain-containing protein [Ideonella sp. YS5]|uniref:YopT-type cysteine protease domain-containing protein n=1 Tax=Ideonella sp. YS5 TaxID=3453714 RepID=UPI003EEC6398